MKVLQHDWASKWALYSPNKVALKEYETDRTLTYSELNEWANTIAFVLKKQYKIKKGDRIAVLTEYSLEYVALFCAAQKLGFIIVPLNYRLSVGEMAYLLADSEPQILIFEKKYNAIIPPQYEGLQIDDCTFFDLKNINDIIAPSPIKEDDPIFILYTSGTTGFPKGALYTYKMLFWNSVNTALALIINSESRTLNFMPPFHTGGWNVLLTPFLHHGGYTCLLKKFDAKIVLGLLQTERCTLFMGVPTMMKMMADLPEFEQSAFPDMYYAIVGGEAMPVSLIEKWATKNVAIRQGFGMTEVGPNLFSLHQDDALRKKGSIGRPNFYVETKIVDENGNESDTGELLLRGPMVTKGYWRNEEATKKSIVDGWFHSGDRVHCDSEGYFFVVDRIKNMYISGGENVYPAEVERVIVTHPAISEAAIIGVPDEKWGETGRVFIVKRTGFDLSETDILTFLKDKLAKFKIPKYIHFVEALPKNTTGKVDKTALNNMILSTERE